MDTVVFNRDSWHYLLARRFAGWNSNRSQDLCTYIRAVAYACFIAAILGVLALVAGYCVGSAMVFWVGAAIDWYVGGKVVYGGMSVWGAMGTFITLLAIGVTLLIGLFMAIINFCMWYRDRYPKKAKPPRSPNFLVEAYRSFKTKTCRRVSFHG